MVCYFQVFVFCQSTNSSEPDNVIQGEEVTDSTGWKGEKSHIINFSYAERLN